MSNENYGIDFIKIINEYGAVLMKREQFSLAMPESMLPYCKSDIKKAIKLADISHQCATFIERSSASGALLIKF